MWQCHLGPEPTLRYNGQQLIETTAVTTRELFQLYK